VTEGKVLLGVTDGKVPIGVTEKVIPLTLVVIPAKAGIQKEMDPHFHGDDKRRGHSRSLFVIPAEAGIHLIS